MRKISPIGWLITVFAALAIVYSLTIPLFEGPDEDDHFRYVKFIADHRALPVQIFQPGGGEAGHQGWQPPLYYALAAILVLPVDTSDFSQHLIRNEQATVVGDATCCGRNLYYHFDDENFPFTHTTLAVHLARLLSVLFGAVTVAATYAIAKLLVGPWQMAIAAAAIVAFNPSFLFASALVSNDSALAAFASLTLLVWVKFVLGDLELDLRTGVILGGLLGVSALVKTTALALVPFTLGLCLFLAWRKNGQSRDFKIFVRVAVSMVLAILAPFGILTGWWFSRNQLIYGDPLASRLVAASALFPRSGELTPAEFLQISLPQFWRTFWGGPNPSDFPPAVLVVLLVLVAMGAVGFLIYFLHIASSNLRIAYLILATWLGILFIALVQFIRTTQGGDQGRYLFPAIAVFGLFLVVGIVEIAGRVVKNGWMPDSVTRFTSAFLSSIFLVLALYVPLVITISVYGRPGMLSPNDLARFPDAGRISFANQIALLGNDLAMRSIKPGDTLDVPLYWQALETMSDSYRVFVHLVGQGNRIGGGVDAIPARGAFPTLYWKPGNAIKDNYYVPVSAEAIPGRYFIEVGLYPMGKPGERLTDIESGDDRAIIGAIKIAPRNFPSFIPGVPLDANFADQIDLIGYDIDGARLILYWRARSKIPSDYKVFVHALDATGRITAQVDREPQDGNYPTSIWDIGEEVRDEYTLDAPIKSSRVELGLYHADTGERLRVSLGGEIHDHIELIIGAVP